MGKRLPPVCDRALSAAFTNLDYLPIKYSPAQSVGELSFPSGSGRAPARSKCLACRRQKDKEADHETVFLRIGCGFERRDGNFVANFLSPLLYQAAVFAREGAPLDR
jgi:hypothetical protein